jgi:hypothetical protein
LRPISIMAGVAAWLDAQGGLDTHSRRKLDALRHTLQIKSEPAD